MYVLGSLLVLSFAAIAHGAPRVVGGSDAPDHKYPYQISFRSGGSHFCSGSILNERWILTAAHCVQRRDPKTFTVSAGTNLLSEVGESYDVELAIVHEEYVSFYHYDIALVRVAQDIVFSDIVKPVALPEADISDYSLPAIFAGWGTTRYGGSLPNKLQEIVLKVLPVDVCKQSQPSSTASHVCTFTKAGEGICHGDSGSPLLVDNVQVGIASYVVPCAVGQPDVYTRVFSYKSWVLSTIDKYNHIFE